jgi:glycosyltransferase involved in cell wall biosynthesis
VRIYWYWPFAREEEIGLVGEVAGPGDELLVDVLACPTSPPAAAAQRWSVRAAVRELPSRRHGSVSWAVSRAVTYVGRALDRRRTVRSFRPDVCHVMFQNRLIDWADLPSLARKAVLVSTVHDVVPHDSRLPAPAERKLLRRLYRRCGHIVVHHESVGRRLVAEFDVPIQRITVIEPQVPALPSTEWAPAPSQQHRLLFFGTLRRNKGLVELLEALRLLPEDDLQLVIAGRGDPRLEELAAEAAANDPRILVESGWITPARKSELYSDCDLVVLPYTSFSSQSGVLHDAYAAGRPLIVTDVGALAETVIRDGSGWVVPPRDSVALAEAIRMSRQDRTELAVRAAGARAVAASRSPTMVGRQLRELYDDVVAGRKPC